MSKKRTLADLMNNDFFIDFDTTTKAKVGRKRLNESLKRRRVLTESINESEVESCYKRVCASAAEERGRVMDDPEEVMLAVEVSKEHLKKALKLGAFSTYIGDEPHTVPAQYVESIDLEFINNILLDEDYCQLAVQLHGEYNDESVNDFLGDDVCFVQFREYPAFDTEEEALEFFETEIRPNATKIAEEMIDEAWAKSGCTDYEGITDLSDTSDDYSEPEDDSELFKADSGSWRSLLDQADSLLAELARKSGNADYDDGDGYWVSEYTIWCNRYLYYSDELNNEAKLKTLCDEYSKKLPGVTFYYDSDADEELSEIGYEANKQVKESVEEPNNAVVDCKVNKVIAHCEDEKPVDCLGKKKPLNKPLTEKAKKMTAVSEKGKDRVELKEARSAEEIKAEIEKLQQELAAAQAAEKKASYGNNLPTEVWIWDVYLEPADKGTWTSAEIWQGKYDGYVFETENDALDAAWSHLSELEDEDELDGDPDDYYVEAFSVPVSEVAEDTLSDSGLDHLIESLKDTNESLKEAATTERYIIAADGEAGGSLYYIGTDYKTALKEFKSTARDWRRYGLGGGDTPVYLYQYFGPARLFNKICSKYNAGEQLDYSINIEELGFDLSDCKILDEEWGD